jgi:hypothetical protein
MEFHKIQFFFIYMIFYLIKLQITINFKIRGYKGWFGGRGGNIKMHVEW